MPGMSVIGGKRRRKGVMRQAVVWSAHLFKPLTNGLQMILDVYNEDEDEDETNPH